MSNLLLKYLENLKGEHLQVIFWISGFLQERGFAFQWYVF